MQLLTRRCTNATQLSPGTLKLLLGRPRKALTEKRLAGIGQSILTTLWLGLGLLSAWFAIGCWKWQNGRLFAAAIFAGMISVVFLLIATHSSSRIVQKRRNAVFFCEEGILWQFGKNWGISIYSKIASAGVFREEVPIILAVIPILYMVRHAARQTYQILNRDGSEVNVSKRNFSNYRQFGTLLEQVCLAHKIPWKS